MSLAHLIRSRRSVHPPAYNNKPIAAEDITAILEAARWAPTHKKTQPWRFVVIRSDARARLADAIGEAYTAHTEKFSEITFDKLTSVSFSATNHEEGQPVHLIRTI